MKLKIADSFMFNPLQHCVGRFLYGREPGGLAVACAGPRTCHLLARLCYNLLATLMLDMGVIAASSIFYHRFTKLI
jgi:hypothetical protein